MPAKIAVPEGSIVADYRAGTHTWRELAAKYGVSEDVIGRVLKEHGATGLRRAHRRASYQHDRTFFDVIDSEAKAYWLGFIAADGCISRRGKKGSRLSVMLGEKDRDHVQRFREAIKAENPISMEATTIGGKVYHGARLSIWGPWLPDALERQGVIARKSLTQGWPDLTDESLRHFLRGYFDGDGHLGFHKQNRAYQMSVIGSTPFIEQWREYMQALGAAPGHLYHPNNNPRVAVLAQGGNRQVSLIHDYLYRDATIALLRKATLPPLPPTPPRKPIVKSWGWAKKHDRCQGCGTTKREHYGLGFCRPCYRRRPGGL